MFPFPSARISTLALMTKVLLAGCAALPRGDGDEDVLLPALAAAGCAVEWIVWDDPAAPISGADLVVLRATWDYSGRREEFLRWCESVPQLRNAPDIVRWNTDKAYLLDLAVRGLPIVPTALVRPGESAEWPDAEFVVKPSVGAGSRGARRFAAGDYDAAGEHLAGLHAGGHSALVQPYQSTVDTAGETALVFVDGTYSHAFVKGPLLSGAGMDTSGLFTTETLAPVWPGPELLAFGEQAMDAAAASLGIERSELLYARVDVVRGAGGEPLLLELELAEPSLGLKLAGPAAVTRLAEAIRAAAG